MTAAGHDIDELLRRALHAAVDHVEPAADGLERIRSRARAPRHARAAAALPGTGWPARAGWAVRRGLSPAGDRLAAAVAAVASRFRPVPGAGRLRWSRPAAAFATAIFVVAAGSWAAAALPNVISPAASTGPSGHSHSQAGHHNNPSPAGGRGGYSFTPGGSGSPTARPSHGARPSCSPSASHTPHGVPSSSPSPSPSPTTSATSPSPTPSPSPSPTTSSPSPTPTVSPTPPQTPTAGSTTAGSTTAAALLAAGGFHRAFASRPVPAKSSPTRSRCGG